ncbi:MAG: tripartite tricarboxylate transporter TctB family protein [Sphingomonadaceae bacterium]
MFRRDLALGAISLAIAAAVWLETADYPVQADISRGLGPAFFPRLLGALIAVFGIVIILSALRASRDAASPLLPNAMPVALLGVMGAYSVLLVPVGFAIATPLFLLAGATMLGLRLQKGILFALGLTAATYLVFKVMLAVPLPMGELLGGL